MPNIVAVPNVWSTCLRILKARGYELSLACHAEEGAEVSERFEKLWWSAQMGGYSMYAKNPTELLGLASVYEFVQPKTTESYWWLVKGEDVLNELLTSVGLGFPR